MTKPRTRGEGRKRSKVELAADVARVVRLVVEVVRAVAVLTEW